MTTSATTSHHQHLERVARTIKFAASRRLSFLTEDLLLALAKVSLQNEAQGIVGRVVEAGVALGGSALVLTAAKASDRPIALYDTFGMIPPPGDHDGADVHERYQVISEGRAQGFEGEEYYGYQDGLLESIIAAFREVGLDPADNLVSFHAGDLLLTMTAPEPVSLVHVDCDWYDPVLHCLTTLGPPMSIGGRFIIDDYGSWSGARRATDEWLASQPDFTALTQDGRVHLVRTNN